VNDRVALADLPGHTIFDGGRLNKDWVLTWGPLVKTFLKTFAPPRGTAGNEANVTAAADISCAADSTDASLNDLDLEAPWIGRPQAIAADGSTAGTAGAVKIGSPQQAPPMLPSLHGVLFLCDIRWPVAPEDRELLRLCKEDLNLPVLLVFTKDDLVRCRSSLYCKKKGTICNFPNFD